MNGMKFNASVILAVVLNFVALTWFLSQQNSKIESMWSDVQELTDKMAIEENVKLKLTVEQLQKDITKLQNREKIIVKDNKKIMKQQSQIFELLSDGNSQIQQNQKGYSYGD
jgi:regulator of replication initiation timing